LWNSYYDRVVEVGYRNEEDEDFMILNLSDLSNVSMIKLDVSLSSGIESIDWIAAGLEGNISLSGFEIGSVDDSLLGLSAFDILLNNLESAKGHFSWSLSYDFDGHTRLKLGVPLTGLGDSKTVRILLELGSNGLGFGLSIPFIADGILVVDKDGFEYKLKKEDISLVLCGGGGYWSLEFEIPSGTEPSK